MLMSPDKVSKVSPCFCLVFLALPWMVLQGGSTEAAARDGDDSWASVTVLYMSDVKGLIEPCG